MHVSIPGKQDSSQKVEGRLFPTGHLVPFILVTATVGGAVLTPIMGLIAESAHGIAGVYSVPLVAYVLIAFYSFLGSKPAVPAS